MKLMQLLVSSSTLVCNTYPPFPLRHRKLNVLMDESHLHVDIFKPLPIGSNGTSSSNERKERIEANKQGSTS